MAETWQNPYAPGTAAMPPVLTGRDDWLGRFDDYFRGLVGGYPIEHVCFWGPRGMGKTVLLERLGEMGPERKVVARRGGFPTPQGTSARPSPTGNGTATQNSARSTRSPPGSPSNSPPPASPSRSSRPPSTRWSPPPRDSRTSYSSSGTGPGKPPAAGPSSPPP